MSVAKSTVSKTPKRVKSRQIDTVEEVVSFEQSLSIDKCFKFIDDKKVDLKTSPTSDFTGVMFPRVIVLIASHLNTKERRESIKYAIKSIKNADHVYVSYSWNDDPPDTKEWEKGEKYTYCPHTTRKLQFEHYQYLAQQFVKDTDIVCFLDDDDLNFPEKIDVVREEFKKDINVLKHNSIPFGYFTRFPDNPISDTSKIPLAKSRFNFEYFNLCMKGWLLKDWFINTNHYTNSTFDELVKDISGYIDLVFKESFRKSKEISQILVAVRRQDGFVRDYHKKKEYLYDEQKYLSGIAESVYNHGVKI